MLQVVDGRFCGILSPYLALLVDATSLIIPQLVMIFFESYLYPPLWPLMISIVKLKGLLNEEVTWSSSFS